MKKKNAIEQERKIQRIFMNKCLRIQSVKTICFKLTRNIFEKILNIHPEKL